MSHFNKLSQRYKNARLQTRLFIAALLPLLMIALLLTGFTVLNQQQQARAHLAATASTTINYLASASQFALYSGNTKELEIIANAAFDHRDVTGVSFIDTEGNTIHRSGQLELPDAWQTALPSVANITEQRQQLHIKRVVSELADVDDQLFVSSDISNDQQSALPLGWVAISISENNLYSSLQNTLITGAILACAGIALSALLSILIARSILLPIGNLIRTVEKIDQGKQSARATVEGTAETKTLARVVNRLADSSQANTDNFQLAVEDATAHLRTAIADAERRNTLLEQTRQDLSNALSTKKEFVARMSHELRTPLTSVMGYTKLLAVDPENDEQQRFKHHALHASQILLERIDDILCFEKIESGNLELDVAPFFLRQCLQDLVSMHSQEASDKGLEIALSIAPDIPNALLGDASRIKQVYNNLIANAIKFTPEGCITIRVDLAHRDDTKIVLSISVNDTGIGIAADNLEKLFAPFVQADNSISRHYGGTGLGLIISKQLLKKMDGDIDIVSEPDKGTQALTKLTLALQDDAINRARNDNANKSDAITSREVYIIEHNDDAREALSNTLRWANIPFHILKHDSELEARLQNTSSEKQYLIYGCNHHNIDSAIEALARIRQQHKIPVIIASSHSLANDAINCEQWQKYQPLHYINKPIGDEQLFLAMGIQCKQSAASAEPQNRSEALRDISICLVEDNQFNRELISDTLSRHRAQVSSFDNAIDAIPYAETQSPQVIITDLHMPEMTGIEFTHYIRNSEIGDNTIIIVLTADMSGKHDILFAGANAILHKPIDEEELINTLLQTLQREQRVPNQSSILPDTPEDRKRWISELQRLCDNIEANYAGIFEHGNAELPTAITQALHDLRGIVSLHNNAPLTASAERLAQAIKERKRQAIEDEIRAFNDLLKAQRQALLQ